ncbi:MULTISPECIES: DUF2945 domain-containing protein [unclassified Mesorhizobium]|uniref:DUF2945 domain-containing protein n=1 Tax=unclassified Mesorhizobium TaxID=325217 RepID=UPI001CCD2A88|nr:MULTISPECIES: DUF2945 domain-containing protein [unclassified Mesorhizobium]MBZ9742878.1 DUF2945 domain-containing protein [Mesorhizobium sp. CO1-1-4]MBZ9805925.1 DUF2945 domain-containing protein [Mesorhizobium sp. ES1-6]
MQKLRKGARVTWKWGAHTADGKVSRSFTREVKRTTKGVEVVREASPGEPAYLIEQADGDHVLKSHSELKQKG